LILKKNITNSLTSIDISSLASNVYVAKLFSADKQISLKFIKE